MKVKCVISGHQWNGCTCERCGEARDVGHVWIPDPHEPCKFHCRCGLQKFQHQWFNGVCTRCHTVGEGFDSPPATDTGLTVTDSLRELLARQRKQAEQQQPHPPPRP